LHQEWESTGTYAQGRASVHSEGHELNLFLFSDCLFENIAGGPSSPSAAQLLTLTIEKVDARYIPSLSGFTLSFRQTPTPDLLRLSLVPDFRARDPLNHDDWRDPPTNLRLISGSEDSNLPEKEEKPSIEKQIESLEQLERQAEILSILIQEKKAIINSLSEESKKALREEIKECDSFICVVKALLRRLHDGATKLCQKFKHSKEHKVYMNHWGSSSIQSPAMLAKPESVAPQSPEACHCRDGKPTELPEAHLKPDKPEASVNAVSEKTGTYAPLASRTTTPYVKSTSTPHSQPEWRDATPPSPIAVFFKFLFAITGLAFICGFIRKRCMSLRTRAERAADRERRNAERLYRRDARRQAVRDWWFGTRRGQPGRRAGDYDEKRTLILRQEGILEEAMQDDIRQLQIQEEIRQLRSTRDAVDDLVRAEEGRSSGPPYYASSSSTSYPHNSFSHHQPTPITIPDMVSIRHPPTNRRQNPFAHPEPYNPFDHPEDSDDENPISPLSRTSSLPDYKTEASSEPPSYDDDMVPDGFSDYTPSTGTQDSHWSPGSSIPDISPRPSIETARTFL
jgi:hypothetical protein